MNQEKSDNHAYFSEKSERLAKHLGINLDAIPAYIGISKDMFYAYRTGRHPISAKAWRKLKQAEIEAGLRKDVGEVKREFKQRLDALPQESRKAVTAPHVAWDHYQMMTSLLDDALKTRRPLPDKQAEDEFQEFLQMFSRGREKGRKAMIHTRDLAERVACLVMESVNES
jgi:hypothetical protein